MFPRIFLLLSILLLGPIRAPGSAAEPPRPWWSLEFAPELATLGVPPDWTRLDPWQETMSRAAFEKLLDDQVASAPGIWRQWIEVTDTHAAILKRTGGTGDRYLLRFADRDAAAPRRYWRPPGEIPPSPDATKPLAGYRIALDPGHMGGAWAKLEERYFQRGEDPPVKEGDMVLKVARLLAARLRDQGAEVLMVRDAAQPVTPLRPEAVEDYTRRMLAAAGVAEPTPAVLEKARNRVFSVNAEIRARAARVNEELRPDLVLALHFNGEPWGDGPEPIFSPENHLHVLVHGCLEPEEMAHDDERLEMLIKMMQRGHATETSLAVEAAGSLAIATGLPPFVYRGKNARPVGGSPYVWARNLLASRLYQCPVVYLEPHVMNHALTYERILAGSYDGKRTIGGLEREDIFREYAHATASAVETWFVREQAKGR